MRDRLYFIKDKDLLPINTQKPLNEMWKTIPEGLRPACNQRIKAVE